MNLFKRYKSFLNSHNLSEGVRITTGVLIPAFTMNYFHMLPAGISISLGALFVSVTDSAGPIHHRKNGMLVCIAAIFLVTLIAGFLIKWRVLLAVFLFLSCFFFSIIGIYGSRAAAIGTAALIVLTLSTDMRLNLTTPALILERSLLITSGGIWYTCFSLLLYNFQPYRLARQTLGDWLQSIARYLLIRSEFYNKEVNYDTINRQLLLQQVTTQHKEAEITEILFKTPGIVEESNITGRRLVTVYLDTADIFERIMMSQQEYSQLHEFFDETDILTDYYRLARDLATELDEIGISVKSGEPYSIITDLAADINNTRDKLSNLRINYLKPDNIAGFISLRRIFENIQNLYDRLNALKKYTYDNKYLKNRVTEDTEYEKMISSQEISLRIFINNLTLKSETFRHSLRVSIAVMAGLMVTLFFKPGHGYWILLTIIVILKPAFSLSRKRNRDRIAGTIAGIIIGVIVLATVNNNIVLIIFLILFMTASYTFMRTNYFVSVLFMTPYLVLFFHLLNALYFRTLLKDRITDTLIGSSIAFAASAFLFPLWEKDKIKPAMAEMLAKAREYFSLTASAYSGQTITRTARQVARKNALVALANLSDAYNRMLSEPKARQKGVETFHRFVILNHKLISYIAALSYYSQMKIIPYQSNEFEKVAEDIKHNFTNAISYLKNEEATYTNIASKDSLQILNDRVNALLQKRKQELEQELLETSTRRELLDMKSVIDQFNLIYTVTDNVNKIAEKLVPGSNTR